MSNHWGLGEGPTLSTDLLFGVILSSKLHGYVYSFWCLHEDLACDDDRVVNCPDVIASLSIFGVLLKSPAPGVL